MLKFKSSGIWLFAHGHDFTHFRGYAPAIIYMYAPGFHNDPEN